MTESANALADQALGIVTTYGLDVVGAIVILIVGWIAAGWAARVARNAARRSRRIDDMLAGFLSGLVKYGILAFTILAVLAQFGVQTASLIAVLGAAGLAVGLAIQGTLTNVAAGVMLMIFRPFKVGDYIDAGGIAGTVDGVDLFITEMHTADNVHMVVPNGELWNKPIYNYSRNPTRRIESVFRIAYEDDPDRAMAIVLGLIERDGRILKDPAPEVVVGELGPSSVDLNVRVWAASGDYWAVKVDLTKAVKEAFEEGGITIPYPQRTVRSLAPAKSAAAE